ncbi:GNAT family N-acetyltransferase [Nonomuraea lactucae]|uniref:GNAT family N-acetyltransferase n=1 Tax=Nonomuraea lactucae TaxID=2249762 RepID=UPI000DE3ACC7|nr:GNAT family N-acetyltransferase [Nonomuraea lactucae]
MNVTLRPMPSAELSASLARIRERYIADQVSSGMEQQAAERIASQQLDELFPNGQPAPGQHMFRVDVDGLPVGELWIGVGPDGDPSRWWVWGVEVEQTARGQGIGRRAMRLAEEEARAHGATELGLNVFGSNTVARSLYESLGYETTAIRMRLPL